MITASLSNAEVAQDAVLLDADEAEAARRLRSSEDRRDYVAAHALLRRMLTAAFPRTAPETWRFHRTSSGKPYVEPEAGAVHPARFSLSHTRGLIACVVGRGLDLGVDVERDDVALDVDALGPGVCSTDEMAQLAQIGARERVPRFLDLWTLKESYAKACGIGVADALMTTAFDLRLPGTVLASIPRQGITPCWFVMLQPSRDSRLSLAVFPPGPEALLIDAARIEAGGLLTRLDPIRIGPSDGRFAVHR